MSLYLRWAKIDYYPYLSEIGTDRLLDIDRDRILSMYCAYICLYMPIFSICNFLLLVLSIRLISLASLNTK